MLAGSGFEKMCPKIIAKTRRSLSRFGLVTIELYLFI
jgi:hypothetical protein